MINFYHTDNLMLMQSKPDKAYDLAIIDPAYGIGVTKMAYTQSLKNKQTKYKPNNWDNKVPDKAFFDEVFRVSKHQIIFGINYFNIENIGSGRIKWDKCVAEGSSFNRFEYAYCSLIEHEIVFQYLWSGMFQGK